MASELPTHVTADSQWLVQAVDPHARLARLVRMDRQDYRNEAFLDDRMLAAGRESRLCSLDELIAAADAVDAAPAGWIFHIGHVGSTLVSRLLGEIDAVLAIREPRSLRDLFEASERERPALAKAVSRLMARTGPGQGKVIVKATSFVSELAPLLIEPAAASLFLYVSPANYIASILAGENSRAELAALHEVRSNRVAGRGVDASAFGGSDASKAALAWACEMTSLEAASDAIGPRSHLWADFDVMLRDIGGSIRRFARHFSLDVDRAAVDKLASSSLMRRYSKALEYDYSPGLREELLADATKRHKADIAVALDELGRAANSAPLLERALRRSEQEL